jgi:cobyrinic acid a,c-diamide synthase
MKRILIAGTASGVGKTTITLSIEAALRRRGMLVQPFKCGPDYLDTAHHTMICGRACRNLDSIILSSEENELSLDRAAHDAEIVVAEGMMGLFDGVAGDSERGSSAEIAHMLHLPVILVMDASHCSRSLAATLLGFVNFDKQIKIAAVILNRVAGEKHFQMLSDAIKGSVNIPILGWIPRNETLAIPERHLGLHDAAERAWSADEIAALAETAEKYLDLDLLLQLAEPRTVDALQRRDQQAPASAHKVKIAVARDAAFSFYYEDNFDLLRDYGAELVEFSPLHDMMLPAGIDALYIGGGYPELHAGELQANRGMMASVREFCRSGKPVYAECGGMMYLARQIVSGGNEYAMTGVLPLRIAMSERLVKFGYVRVRFDRDCVLGPAGMEAVGHSFHYSRIESIGPIEQAYALRYLRADREEHEGYLAGNVLASYIHLHFRGNRRMAEEFVQSAIAARGAA